MCGICGIVSNKVVDTLDNFVKSMVNTLKHRGPDADGIFINEKKNVCLGHTRLSIIDLSSAGNQPMTDSTGRYVIVFNGEIYKYKEIREEIEKERMVKWMGNSDTEALVEGFSLWRENILDKLRGDFAFAVYDREEDSVFLARDHMGVKPLYYYKDNNTFAFASETKAFEKISLFNLEINKDTISRYFKYYAFLTPETPYKNVLMLEPGHFIYFKNGNLVKKNYWKVDWNTKLNVSKNEITSLIGNELLKSVEYRLVSDVPLGIFLSGGIDSSSIVALAREIRDDIHTFSIIFDDVEFSEELYAHEAAKHFMAHHHEIKLDYNDLLKIFPDYEKSIDLPSGDGLNTFFVSHYTKKAGITVALSGLGGDELFCGYSSFWQLPKWKRILSFFPDLLKNNVGNVISTRAFSIKLRKLGELLKNNKSIEDMVFLRREVFSNEEINELTGINPIESPVDYLGFYGIDNPVDTISAIELRRYMLNTLLRDSDVMSLASAIELRVPLIDHKLVELLAHTPAEFKVDKKNLKNLLVSSLPKGLPESVIYREKKGFTLPLEKWLRRKEILDYIDNAFSFDSQFINSSYARQSWNRFKRGDRRSSASHVWTLYTFLIWEKRISG